LKAVTLLYHDVITGDDFQSSGFKGGDADIYKLELQDFIEHIETIVDKHKLVAENLDSLHSGRCSTGHVPFYITFDDGGVSFLDPIAQTLEKHGWKGIFFISTDFIGTPGFLTKEQIVELSERGHVIGSHSCSHPKRFSDCTYEQILHEWTESKNILTAIINKNVDTASVPGGFLSKEVELAAAEAGFKSLFTSEPQKEVYEVEGCSIVGRYSVIQGILPAEAASLASLTITRDQAWHYIYWKIKKIGKTYFASLYRWYRDKRLNS